MRLTDGTDQSLCLKGELKAFFQLMIRCFTLLDKVAYKKLWSRRCARNVFDLGQRNYGTWITELKKWLVRGSKQHIEKEE